VLQKTGIDYTAAGSTIQFVAAATPQPGDILLASYRVSGDQAAAPQMYPGPQVLCAGTGAATGAQAFANIGACSIPAGVLAPGDRVEIRFDLSHQGSASGFTYSVLWGATTVVQRDATAAETLVSGRADAAILASGAQLSAQSWGAVLPFSATALSAPDAWAGGLSIGFQAKVPQAGDTVALSGFSIVRLP
jgi:hypothetical protein